MAHNLDIFAGQASMFYVGEPPWHWLGTRFERPPRDSSEAIHAARLNWRVRKAPLLAQDPNGNIPVADKYAIVREDRRIVLGVVSGEYQPLQNEEAFRFFDGIIDIGAAEYETAGALGNGEKIWILVKMKAEPMLIAGFDEVQKYLLLFNSHDGSSSVHIRFTPIRVVCQNTLTVAMREGTRLRAIVHRHGLHRHLEEARQLLESIVNTYRDIERHFTLMARVKVDEKRLQEYIEAVFPLPKTTTEMGAKEKHEQVLSLRNKAARLFTDGMGNRNPAIEGTLWAAYNAVTELIDHKYWQRRHPKDLLRDIWLGEGSKIKVRAYREAVARLNRWG